ncbi:MAG: CHASE2 domain-containing protein [Desulfonatronovibrionaceae bacterium]
MIPDRMKRPAPILIALTVVTLLVGLGYFLSLEFLRILELKSYDLRLKARGRIPVSGKVAVVAVDEKSLEEIGRWPWSRSVMADLVRRIDSFSPRVVGFDISFFDPQKTSAREELTLLPNPRLGAYIKKRLAAASPDLNPALSLAGFVGLGTGLSWAIIGFSPPAGTG